MRRNEEREEGDKLRKILHENEGSEQQSADQASSGERPENAESSMNRDLMNAKKSQRRTKPKLPLKSVETSKHKRKQSGQAEDLRERYLSDATKYRGYKNLKYKNSIYRVGDAAYILNEDDPSNDFLCKLLAVYRVDEEEKTHVFIEVQW